MSRSLAILATAVLAGSLTGAAGAQVPEQSITRIDRFAFDVLNPSMEFAWTTHRIRWKLLASLGVPDEMELNTVPDRTSDWWYAQERWSYHGGPTLIISSNDYEWLERQGTIRYDPPFIEQANPYWNVMCIRYHRI